MEKNFKILRFDEPWNKEKAKLKRDEKKSKTRKTVNPDIEASTPKRPRTTKPKAKKQPKVDPKVAAINEDALTITQILKASPEKLKARERLIKIVAKKGRNVIDTISAKALQVGRKKAKRSLNEMEEDDDKEIEVERPMPKKKLI